MQVPMTTHAKKRINERGISRRMYEAAVIFGKKLRANGSLYYFLGKKELQKMQQIVQIANPEKWEGTTLVCDPVSGLVITMFKNKAWPKKIRHRK
jgi:hypothetical protein